MAATLDKDDLGNYIKALVSPLLTRPEEARCEHIVDDLGTLYLLDLSKEDMGRVIGKNGMTIGAIRLVVRTAGLTHGIRANLKLKDEYNEAQ